ncbi:MAG TPA: hypothetical protein VGF99_21985 [Myxococcota bacterium]
MTTKLNQVLAVEKGIKQRAYTLLTDANKAVQKSASFNGFSKVYQPNDGDAETLPPETVRVQNTSTETLHEVQRALVELFDITLTKDVANQSAVADVRLDNGTVIAAKVPATNLLFLEKQLTDVKTFIGNLPELDPSESWTFDANASLFKSEPTRSNRTKKVQKAIVLYDATDKHPAQTQLITEDTVVGVYTQTKMSGAVPLPQKRAMLNRVDELLRAVQKAREEANAVVAADQRIGAAIFNFLLNG